MWEVVSPFDTLVFASPRPLLIPMLPFALKVIWFCLSFSGVIACWVVLYTFSHAVGSYWAPGLYSVFATLSQGIFCLGMIYNMNPLQMPKVFCIIQTFVIYYSAWSLTGICAAFMFAASSSVLWPSPMKHSDVSTLAWKNEYYFPVFIFPLACLSVSLPVILSTNAIKPTDNLYCDASQPEWARFLGYAGLPMILGIPSLFLSVAASRRALQLHHSNQHSQRTGPSHLVSQLSNRQNATSVLSPGDTAPASVDPCPTQSTTGTGVQNATLHYDPDIPPSSGPLTLSLPHKRYQMWELEGTIDEGDRHDRRGQVRGIMLFPTTDATPLPKTNLAPVIWRLILFQTMFFATGCLGALSTIIDVVRHRPTPTPFGSQHIALILVGWGPVVVLGHTAAVRRQLMFWKR